MQLANPVSLSIRVDDQYHGQILVSVCRETQAISVEGAQDNRFPLAT